MRLRYGLCLLLLVGLFFGQFPTSIAAQSGGAVRDVAGFEQHTLPRNDDGFTERVSLGFEINFFGETYDQVYVNNNGNVTFDVPLETYTPFDLTSTQRVIIAAFFADVDTRSPSPGITAYGVGTVDGHAAFGVNWVDVGYYDKHVDKLSTVQLILIDRSDITLGDFDIEFNYDKVLWETGDASDGSGGMGGVPARVGYSNGTRDPNTFYELSGSAISGAFLDSNSSSGLIHNSFNSTQLGRYIFEVRNGVVLATPTPRSDLPVVSLPPVTGPVAKTSWCPLGTIGPEGSWLNWCIVLILILLALLGLLIWWLLSRKSPSTSLAAPPARRTGGTVTKKSPQQKPKIQGRNITHGRPAKPKPGSKPREDA